MPNLPKAEREAKLRDVPTPSPHQALWAEYERHAGNPAPVARKTQVALRIGVFFDGTLNNAGNSALGLRCGAQHPIEPRDLEISCKPYMSDPDSSYGNDVTNIKKLSELYHAPRRPEGSGDFQHGYRVLYIEGIGTTTGEADRLLGMAMGRGETGVVQCVQRAFTDIGGLLNRFRGDNPDCEIVSLTFDAFGFSRGAAAARHFANLVALGGAGPLGIAIATARPAFSRLFVDGYQRDVHMGFIGLFDTVASTGGMSNLGNVRSAVAAGLRLQLPRNLFGKVVHLVARDEYRANFALNSVAPEHTEIVLPGAHSDIGGGYLPLVNERVLVSPMQALDVPLGLPVEATSIYRDAAQARDRWITQGWPAEMLTIVTPEPQSLEPPSDDLMAPPRKRVYAALQLTRPVRGELSRVYLRVMYALARAAGVRFMDIPDISDFHLPAELAPLSERFEKGDYEVLPKEDAVLLRTYIHMSANWNPPARLRGNTPRTGLALTFINAPASDAQRVLHPHASSRGW
nr:DUF2235 domain-containing protein [Stutzerimonas azotifigens]